MLTALCGWLPIAGIYLAGASCSFFAAYNSRIKENKKELEEDRSLIKEGVDYLERNLSCDCSVDSLASLCNLSPSAFRRIFQKSKGMSPVKYRNRLRIRKATELLRSGAYTVGEVAEQVGVADVKYFGKLFKQYTGMNPSELKKGGIQDQFPEK